MFINHDPAEHEYASQHSNVLFLLFHLRLTTVLSGNNSMNSIPNLATAD